MTWFYGLLPGFSYGVFKDGRWEHFCKLVAGAQVAFQVGATIAQLKKSHSNTADWKWGLEVDFAKLKISRLHFMPQCTHAVLHDADDYIRNGPLIASSQFPIERYIGMLGDEIQQPSNPFGNIAKRALRFAQVNALLAMYPALDRRPPPVSSRPGMTASTGNGFILLHPRDNRPSQHIEDLEQTTILEWLESVAGDDWERCWEDSFRAIQKWSRCYLPNGQIARSRMREVGRQGLTRRSRNVKYVTDTGLAFGEVYYYFSLPVSTDRHAKRRTVALVSRYGDPDPTLLEKSSGVLWAARHLGEAALTVIDVKYICSVVGMIPHDFQTPHTQGVETLWFVLEKLGTEVGWVRDLDEDKDAEDNDDDEEEDDDDED
ncbi:unnamed protein product [Peniophora sp. CBMAI 1063]|nr:unnamed protein product [Peniophora sp. CBMAI 1063]